MKDKPFTHDELMGLNMARLANGIHVIAPAKVPVTMVVAAYHEQDILPALRNVVGASVFMYQALSTQRDAIATLIERCETVGGEAERLVPMFTSLLQSVDMGCRSAIDGVTATAALFKSKGEPNV